MCGGLFGGGGGGQQTPVYIPPPPPAPAPPPPIVTPLAPVLNVANKDQTDATTYTQGQRRGINALKINLNTGGSSGNGLSIPGG